MTLAAVKQMTARLTKAQRLKLAADLLEENIPSFREPISLAELERRADEVESGKVKALSLKQFRAGLEELKNSIVQRRRARQRG
jgi:hypothetical protein